MNNTTTTTETHGDEQARGARVWGADRGDQYGRRPRCGEFCDDHGDNNVDDHDQYEDKRNSIDDNDVASCVILTFLV